MILQNIYASVDDVDLYIGALLEPVAPGSVVGITFRDIIADQFSRFKRGDRYFYNLHPNINPGHFTPGKLINFLNSIIIRYQINVYF